MEEVSAVKHSLMLDKIDTLKHTMDRYDHYYDSINNKGNLYLTLNTFLLGGIITGYYSIKDIMLSVRFDIITFVWIGLICSSLSLVYTLWAILPYLNKQADSMNRSIINFSDISHISLESFGKIYADVTDEKKYNDYLQQVYALACGLQKKFCRLKVATYLLGGCFVSIIIIGIKILR